MPGGAHENMKAWSPEEDTLIIAMHESEGPKWSKIVQRLPGRTVSSVRNRWQRIEKGRKLREAGVESKKVEKKSIKSQLDDLVTSAGATVFARRGHRTILAIRSY